MNKNYDKNDKKKPNPKSFAANKFAINTTHMKNILAGSQLALSEIQLNFIPILH